MHKAVGLLLGLSWQALAVPLSKYVLPAQPPMTRRSLIQSSLNEFYPSSIALGNSTNQNTHPFTTFTLDKNTPVATLDYGYEVAGYPFFQVSNFKGKVQLESRLVSQDL
jgi:hypothetical protein